MSTAITDIYFAQNLVFHLLGFYFINDPIYFGVNTKIQNLIKAIIVVCKIKFKPEYFMKSINHIGLKNPLKAIRDSFKIYYPVVRVLDNDIKPPENSNDLTDDEYVKELYTGSINFWSDMVEIAKLVEHPKDKEYKLNWIKERLEMMNKSLPSFVFIPSSSK